MSNVSSILGLFILFLNMNVFASECTQQTFSVLLTVEKLLMSSGTQLVIILIWTFDYMTIVRMEIN